MDETNNTSHDVIQCYIGVATVDAEHQVIVEAEAFGQGQEHDLLKPMVDGMKEMLGEESPKESKILANIAKRH